MDYRLIIDVKDVTLGDVQALAIDILNDHGDDFDASRGEFTIRAEINQGGHYFAADLDDEVVDGA